MLVTSEQVNEIAGAMAKAQAAMGNAIKEATNPAFRSKYATLASVRAAVNEPIASQGLAIIQAPSAEGAHVTVETRIVHSSGQWMASTLAAQARDATPQGIGSAVTYLRRYALMAMCGIAPSDEDDDGNSASLASQPRGKRKEQPEERPQRQSQHDPSWADDQRAFMARLAEPDIGATYDEVCAECERLGRPRPSQLTADQRRGLVTYLASEKGQRALREPIDPRKENA